MTREPDPPCAPAVATRAVSAPRAQLLAAGLGNALEYYDFVVYAFLAAPLSHRFFPNDSDVAALLATFATFGAGFLARPAGGAIIGWLADRRGRRPALLLAVFGMAAGTVGMGLLPTFETIGTAAPVLLVCLRLLQGLSAGGGWGSATTFIAESAPPSSRGLYTSIGQACITSSTLLGSVVVAIVNATFSPADVDRWAWRIPFLLGALLVPAGVYMQRRLDETPAFHQLGQSAGRPGAATVSGGVRPTATAFGLTIVWTASFYIMLSYMPTFTARYCGLDAAHALWSNAAALVVLVLLMPVFGLVSDRIGRKPLLLLSCLGFVVLPYPLFRILVSGTTFGAIVSVQIVFNLLIAAFSGAAPAALAELFPARSRTMLMSIGYSLSTAIFGGFAPFVATWAIAATGSPLAPTLYLIGSAVVSGLVIVRMRETAHATLS